MIEFRDSCAEVEPEQLEGFFEGWPDPPSVATHLRLLKSSSEIVLALDGTTGKVVGFVTAIADGVLCAYVPLLEVLPAYRGRGIGSTLVRRIVGKLEHLYMIDVICDEDVVPFYQRLGLEPTRGMSVRNYHRQSGA